ncbi:acetolactate synthase large subunit [Micractinium conductrix]|uniref:Acetolactate synthase large subunit n=1 Tax=Micractinium conductrix TaxID=554055 RepID=A0A2P6VE70_9CHLO|nr:acetolactate synthase large subunit [Micractinium conductrix]|eukprot:PSC72378.1 acetolactate synthase large subunit [Micractinium conductrix]
MASAAKPPSGAERLLQAAVAAGVKVCFANPGTSEMHFVSALDSVGGMRAVLGLHETVCSGAADGYGRMARRPALTLLHLGPGLANATANLHNARRAGTPLVNLVGDMATWHKGADPLLNSDIAALASTVGTHVHACTPGEDLGAAMAAAVGATAGSRGAPGDSRVATLIVPHDLSWQRSEEDGAAVQPHANVPAAGAAQGAPLPAEVQRFVREAAAALRACPRGKAALYIGGAACLAEGDALPNVGRIAAATGAALLCENAFARLDRGAGLPTPARLPYFPQDAAAALAPYHLLLVLDARRPVANFGYDGAPSQLVTLPDEAVWEFDSRGVDLPALLALLAAEVGGHSVTPGVNCCGVFATLDRPALPTGRLTAAALCQTVATLQPEGTILVDESLTSGGTYFNHSAACPPFTHLTLTGGAIGAGIPLALGAAVACPDRVVINLQADGSGMYSLQGLWSQAREGARVITIICSNRSYAILKVEMARERITPSTGKAARALTELGTPPIDWVSLAQGMGVPGSRAATCEELAAALTAALARQGPSLIEAAL